MPLASYRGGMKPSNPTMRGTANAATRGQGKKKGLYKSALKSKPKKAAKQPAQAQASARGTARSARSRGYGSVLAKSRQAKRRPSM